MSYMNAAVVCAISSMRHFNFSSSLGTHSSHLVYLHKWSRGVDLSKLQSF